MQTSQEHTENSLKSNLTCTNLSKKKVAHHKFLPMTINANWHNDSNLVASERVNPFKETNQVPFG